MEAVTSLSEMLLLTAHPMLNFNVLQNQQLFDSLLIHLLEDGEVVEVSLLFGRFFREDVAVISVLPLDLSRSGKRETLFGTGVGLKLCHCL